MKYLILISIFMVSCASLKDYKIISKEDYNIRKNIEKIMWMAKMNKDKQIDFHTVENGHLWTVIYRGDGKQEIKEVVKPEEKQEDEK